MLGDCGLRSAELRGLRARICAARGPTPATTASSPCKGGREREVPVPEAVQQALEAWTAVPSRRSTPSSVRLRESLVPDQIVLGADAALLAVALAERLRTAAGAPTHASAVLSLPPNAPGLPTGAVPPSSPVPASGGGATGLHLEITATEDDLFVLNQSLAKLRDLLGGGRMRLTLSVEAHTADRESIDRVRVRNSVIEPLEEDPHVQLQARWVGPADPEV